MKVNEYLFSHLTSEMKVLMLSIVDIDEDAELELNRLVSQRLDWNEIFQLSLWHKIAFVVLQRLISGGFVDQALQLGNLPLLILNHWKQLYAVNRHRNMLLRKTAQEISVSFNTSGIPLAVSKGGLLLIDKCYTEAERKMYDVDFLGRRSDIDAIRLAMNDVGFQMAEYNHSTGALEPISKAKLRNWLLFGRGLPNFIKLEADPFHPYSIAQIQFDIGSSETGKLVPSDTLLKDRSFDGRYNILSESALFLQLCLHIYRENNEAAFKYWNMDFNLIKMLDLARYICFLYQKDQNWWKQCYQMCVVMGFEAESNFALVQLRKIFYIECLDEVADESDVDLDDILALSYQLQRVGLMKNEEKPPLWDTLVGNKSF